MKIFSGSSNVPLVERICENLKLPVGKVFLKTFGSDEKYCQFKENIRGSDLFLVQSTSTPANDNLMELLVMCDAARRASAGRITAVIPYFGYARQDRKDKSRVPISGKLVMNLLEVAGVNRILTMDLHSAQTVGFTDLPVDQLSFRGASLNKLRSLNVDCVVAPDIGSIKRAEEYATALGVDLAIIVKKRKNDISVEIQQFIGDVKGKRVLIVDDLTESAGTLVEASVACRKEGATEIYCAISHGCFTDVGIRRLIEAFHHNLITNLFVSNSVAIPDRWLDRDEKPDYDDSVMNYRNHVLDIDVAPLFASAIERIHNNQSISELFDL